MSRTIEVVPYNPSWPEHYQVIANKLASYLDADEVKYSSIEHVGSTSVPDLAAKDNIDILIIVPDGHNAKKAREALTWRPPPTEYYECIGDGGIRGRISMKFHDRDAIPKRSVYIVSEDDAMGMVVARCHFSLRDTLRKVEHQDLKRAYQDLKLALAAEGIEYGIEYGRRKNQVIRQILKVAGWTDEEVDVKESLDTRVAWDPPTPPY